jgi:hypothetical protein
MLKSEMTVCAVASTARGTADDESSQNELRLRLSAFFPFNCPWRRRGRFLAWIECDLLFFVFTASSL